MWESMKENPLLYDIAKQITLEAGFHYTDPRTGVTTKTRKAQPKMPNTGKKPMWVLFDQLHVDVEIHTTKVTDKARRDLRALLESDSFKNLVENVIVGPYRDRIRVKINK